MSDVQVITLGGKAFEVAPPPLKRLKRLIPAISALSVAIANAGARFELTDADLQHVTKMLSAALDKPEAEVDEMPMDMAEISDAILTLAEVAGLTPKGDMVGEGLPVMPPATALTPSTA